MSLSPREAEAFARIVKRVGDPELRRDRVRLWLVAATTVTVFSVVMMLIGWGWLPVAAFCLTFVPGVAAASALIHRRRGGGDSQYDV